MDNGLLDKVKKNINKDPNTIVTILSKQGYEEEHIRKAIVAHHDTGLRHHPQMLIGIKESTERLASGSVSQQFINILLSLHGVSLVVIGLITGLKALLDVIVSSIMREYHSRSAFTVFLLVVMGVTTSALILGMGIALTFSKVWLFILFFILTGVFIVVLGDTYQSYSKQAVKAEEKSVYLRKLSQIGLIFVILGLFLGGNLLENKASLILYFGVASLFLLVSNFSLLWLIPQVKTSVDSLSTVVSEVFSRTASGAKRLCSHRVVLIILIGGGLTSAVQVMGSAYYGIFIYKGFVNQALGGYLNIALIFSIAIATALISPSIARMLSKKYGTVPQLVFGTLLIALQPLAYAYNPFLLSLSMATMLGVIGAAIVGLATGILLRNELSDEEQLLFYSSFPILLSLPMLILVPVLSILSTAVGLKIFFLILAASLMLLVAPLYFSLLFFSKKRVV